MSGIEQRMAMAYALGYVDYVETVGENPSIELSEVNPEWTGYKLVCCVRKETENDRYMIWYHGDFGVEERFALIIDVLAGFDIDHVIHLLTQAIICHKAELRKKESLI